MRIIFIYFIQLLYLFLYFQDHGSLESLESYLESVPYVAPIVDELGQTPLDIALNNNQYAHCKALIDAYIKNDVSALASLNKPL